MRSLRMMGYCLRIALAAASAWTMVWMLTWTLAPTALAQGATRLGGFRFAGNTVFDSSVLEAVVADAIGQEITFDALQAVAQRITDFYRERGYVLARAVLPEQEIRDGIVEIRIVEGRFGEVALDNASRLRDEVAERYMRGMTQGAVVHASRLNRPMLLLDDLPGVVAGVSLSAGQAPGTTGVRMVIRDDRRIEARISANNHGNPSTGTTSYLGEVAVNNISGRGDRLSLSASSTGSGLAQGTVRYEIPVGGSGLTADLAYSFVRYRLGGGFAALDASGDTRGASAEMRLPLVRSSESNLTGSLTASHRRMEDRVGALAQVTSKQIATLTTALRGDRTFAAGGGLTYGMDVTFGQLAFLTDAAKTADAATANAAGNFARLSVNGSLTRPITPRVTLNATIQGQFASKNLDSSEKFSLGGPSGVRAFGGGEASGDHGWLARVETRYQVPASPAMGAIQLQAFVDGGSVVINRDPWVDEPNTRTLTGAGIGLVWSRRPMTVEAIYATPLAIGGASGPGESRSWIRLVWDF